MARANQCDRCKELYMDFVMEGEPKQGQRVKYNGYIRVYCHVGIESTFDEFDLCPACFSELAKFLNISCVED